MVTDARKQRGTRGTGNGGKVTMIQSWFNLLNTDERFVIEKHLLEELEWPRVAFTFTEKWKGEFSRTERTLIGYQASGLA